MSALTPFRTGIAPWRDFESIQDRLDRLFGPSFSTAALPEAFGWVPSVDLVEADGEFVLTAELPGLEPGEVEIDIEDDVLTLKGEKKTEREEKENGRVHLLERSYGSFERSFTLPRTVNAEGIKADFDNGVLTVHLPRRPEAKGRRIQIGAGGKKKH